ncbi:hypothetical protein EC973_005875 [Apophysomyces ossiformis]|uniref:Uncharacterized protein n=1 Tax=Apophysomyces ossiformis TaxID=679940 RepID=A0A8H7BNW0_9FUNG|nr:hypothetical protein EC973_005875 [Apophysomyces ossiformis]
MASLQVDNGLIIDPMTNRIMSVDEWVYLEIERIEERRERYCDNYEELNLIIDQCSHAYPSYPPPPSFASSSSSSSSSYCAPHVQAEQQQEQAEYYMMPSYVHFVQEDLICAWTMLLDHYFSYYRHISLHTESRPTMLLSALERLEEQADADLSDLIDILFGRFRLSRNLVQPWNVLCAWARHFEDSEYGRTWVILGLEAYQTAKYRYYQDHQQPHLSFSPSAPYVLVPTTTLSAPLPIPT